MHAAERTNVGSRLLCPHAVGSTDAELWLLIGGTLIGGTWWHSASSWHGLAWWQVWEHGIGTVSGTIGAMGTGALNAGTRSLCYSALVCSGPRRSLHADCMHMER